MRGKIARNRDCSGSGRWPDGERGVVMKGTLRRDRPQRGRACHCKTAPALRRGTTTGGAGAPRRPQRSEPPDQEQYNEPRGRGRSGPELRRVTRPLALESLLGTVALL